MKNWITNDSATHALDFIKCNPDLAIGPPQKTDAYTAEELEAIGLVGIYSQDLGEKYGENFVRDTTKSNVIGEWVKPKTQKYRRRWNGEKYVYEDHF